MEVLDKYGPVAVAIDASHPSFVTYSDGYFGLENTCNNNGSLG